MNALLIIFMPLFSMFECQVPTMDWKLFFFSNGFHVYSIFKALLNFLIREETSSFAPNICNPKTKLERVLGQDPRLRALP
jgi:hypothetical protein